jgi:two-component system, OmpR family, response regulator
MLDGDRARYRSVMHMPNFDPTSPHPAAHIVVVDDDREIRELLASYLAQSGFRVETAADAVALDRLLARGLPDLIVLDLMLPGENGLAICRRLRAKMEIPILMLTAVADPVDRVIGLELGADDYLTKPFLPRELLARIRAVLKRRGPLVAGATSQQRRYRFGAWELDETGCTLRNENGGEPQALTGGEFRLIHAFIRSPGRVFTRDDLARIIHGRDVSPFERSIDVAVSRMRRRLGDSAKEPNLIVTVHALGYVFRGKVKTLDS